MRCETRNALLFQKRQARRAFDAGYIPAIQRAADVRSRASSRNALLFDTKRESLSRSARIGKMLKPGQSVIVKLRSGCGLPATVVRVYETTRGTMVRTVWGSRVNNVPLRDIVPVGGSWTTKDSVR